MTQQIEEEYGTCKKCGSRTIIRTTYSEEQRPTKTTICFDCDNGDD